MKIIKNGKLKKDFVCKDCECIFQIDKNDIQDDFNPILKSYGLMSNTTKHKYVECPECGNIIFLELEYKND